MKNESTENCEEQYILLNNHLSHLHPQPRSFPGNPDSYSNYWADISIWISNRNLKLDMSKTQFPLSPGSLSVPKATLKFDDLLDRLSGIRKVVMLMFMIYYKTERTQIKLSKWWRYIKCSPGNSQASCRVSLPVKSEGTHLIQSAKMYDNPCTMLSTREAHLSLSAQEVYWGINHGGMHHSHD